MAFFAKKLKFFIRAIALLVFFDYNDFVVASCHNQKKGDKHETRKIHFLITRDEEAALLPAGALYSY